MGKKIKKKKRRVAQVCCGSGGGPGKQRRGGAVHREPVTVCRRTKEESDALLFGEIGLEREKMETRKGKHRAKRRKKGNLGVHVRCLRPPEN